MMTIFNLSRLPPKVLKTLFQIEPQLVSLFLYGLGSRDLHRLSLEIVYEDLRLFDGSDLSESGGQGQVSSILRRPDYYGPLVKALEISSQSISSNLQDTTINSESDGHHLSDWDSSLSALIGGLTNLRSFSWSTDRLPSPTICQTLGYHCQTLEYFNLDIIPLSISRSTRHSLHNKTNSTNTNDQSDRSDDDELREDLPSKPLRWDPDSIDALPPTLTQLSISSLSSNGAKAFSNALEALTWPSLTRMKISKTLFFDDDLISSIVIGCKKLRYLSVESMAGTKLTDRGVLELFNGLDNLQEIELIDVDGRFSKTGWLKLDGLPVNLRSIKFKYQENGLYHSWTLEHLENIFSLLSLYPNQLEILSVQRCVPLPAMLPGRHDTYPYLAVSQRTVAKKISKEQVLKIVEEGQNLKELAIDWWLITIEGLEVIVRGLPNLTNLRVLVDCPFHRIISSTAFLHSKIQTLIVSIPPEHTPFLHEMGMTSPSDKSSFGNQVFTEALSSSQPQSQHSPTSTSTTAANSSNSPIPTRDLKKFIKRAGQLKEIQWTGRGGIGRWTFFRNSGSAVNVKVKFVPIVDELGPEVFEMIQRQESEELMINRTTTRYRSGSCISAGKGCVKSFQNVKRRRRRSSVTSNGDRSGDEESESRRSSSMGSSSLDTSWSSNHNLGTGIYYSSSSLNNLNSRNHHYRNHYHQHGMIIGLEGIPGTPHNEDEINSSNNNEGSDKKENCLNGINRIEGSDKCWIGDLERRVEQIKINGNY